MAEKPDSESEDELRKCSQDEFRYNELDVNKPGMVSSMVNAGGENKSSSEDLVDSTGVKAGECKRSYEEPRDSKVTNEEARVIESVNEAERDGKLADGKLGEKKLTDTELAGDKPALTAVDEVKPINRESNEEKPSVNQTVEFNQTDIESCENNSELGNEKPYDREKCEENKSQEEKKKKKITVSGIKQYIEFFKERLMLYQFIQSLEDEDFFKFANELEGKSYIEKGFTDKMIKDLEEEIPRVRDSMEKRRNQRIAEEKEKKKKHEEAKRKFQEHLKKQHEEEEKRKAEQEAKEMKEWEERRAKWRAIMNRTEEEKRKRLEEIRAQEKAKTKESSSDDDDEEEEFVEIHEKEIVNKEGNESPAEDKIKEEVEPSASVSVDDKEFEPISEKELVHIEQNESSKEHETKVVESPQTKPKSEEEKLEDVDKADSNEQDHQETQVGKENEVGDEKGDNLTTKDAVMEDDTSKEEEDDVEEKVKELSEEEQKKLEEEKKEEERKKKFELEERRVYLILWTERTRKRTRRLRLLKKMQEKKLFTPGNMDQVVKIARDADLSEELVNHVVERPVIPSLLKYVEKLELKMPISDEDAKNFVMTPRFKDQIAWRTQKDQLKDLAKCLKEENREPTMDKIENDYKKTYNKCYALLTILMEEAGRNDWLYVKNCYKKVPDSAEIIKDMEVIINQHIQDQIPADWKDDYNKSNSMHPLKEKIMVNNSSRRHQLSIYLNGQDGSYTYDWKRVVRNMEFDEEDEKRMQIRYLDVDSMITNIDHDNEKLSDKCYKMLEELERIKGGELSWPRLKPALERIDRIGCANNFEWYMHCDFNCQRRKDREALQEDEKKKKKEVYDAMKIHSHLNPDDYMEEIEQREKEEEMNKGASFWS